VFAGEHNREELASILSLRCAVCNAVFIFATSSRIQKITGGVCWECNLAAVRGQMTTGGGHTTLTEFMSVKGMPVMTKKAFMYAEKRIDKWWWVVLQELMKEAGEDEKAIAISRNQYHGFFQQSL